jgi:hypothetical protein
LASHGDSGGNPVKSGINADRRLGSNQLRSELSRLQVPPIKGVFHLAGGLSTQKATALTHEKVTESAFAKISGAFILHELSQEWPVEFLFAFPPSVPLGVQQIMAPML